MMTILCNSYSNPGELFHLANEENKATSPDLQILDERVRNSVQFPFIPLYVNSIDRKVYLQKTFNVFYPQNHRTTFVMG